MTTDINPDIPVITENIIVGTLVRKMDRMKRHISGLERGYRRTQQRLRKKSDEFEEARNVIHNSKFAMQTGLQEVSHELMMLMPEGTKSRERMLLHIERAKMMYEQIRHSVHLDKRQVKE